MSEQNFGDSADREHGRGGVRPPFLTVLCFLTFASAFSGLWRQADQLWSPGRAAVATRTLLEDWMERMERQTSGNEGEEAALQMVNSILEGITPERVQRAAIIMLIYESLTLYGAYYMYHMRKKGFYLYFYGVMAGLLGTIFFLGGLSGIVLTIGTLFFSFIFLGLYRIHLKYMH